MLCQDNVLTPEEAAWVVIEHIVTQVGNGAITATHELRHDPANRVFDYRALLLSVRKIADEALKLAYPEAPVIEPHGRNY